MLQVLGLFSLFSWKTGKSFRKIYTETLCTPMVHLQCNIIHFHKRFRWVIEHWNEQMTFVCLKIKEIVYLSITKTCVLIFELKMIKCEWTEQSLVFVQNNINMKSICSLKSICVAFWNKCWSSRGFRKTDIHEKVTKQWRILSE